MRYSNSSMECLGVFFWVDFKEGFCEKTSETKDFQRCQSLDDFGIR